MRIDIDGDVCIGAGQCVLAAPDVFDQSEDDGVSFVADADAVAHHRADVVEAAHRCPAQAIVVSGRARAS